jgi:hypothetical protein
VAETLNKHPLALLWAGAYFGNAPLLGCYPTLSMWMAYCCSSNHSQGLFFHLVLLRVGFPLFMLADWLQIAIMLSDLKYPYTIYQVISQFSSN